MDKKAARLLPTTLDSTHGSHPGSPVSRDSFAAGYQHDSLGDTVPHRQTAVENEHGASAEGFEEIAPETRRLVHIEAVRSAFDSSSVPLDLANCYLSAKLEHGPWHVTYADDDIKLEKVRGEPLSQRHADMAAHSGASSINGSMLELQAEFGHNYRLLLDSMPRVVVHLKKKKQRYHNVTLAAGSFSLDAVQDRIDGLIRAREIAIKAEVNTAKARAVLAEAQNKAAQASKVATRESLPSPEPRATSENDLAGNNIASTAHTATVDDEETKAAAAAAVRLQASVTAAEAAVGRAESERRAAAVAFETASAAVAAAVIVVPLRATKQEHPRSNRQASVVDRQGNNAPPASSSGGGGYEDEEEHFEADGLANNVQGEILGQVALLVRFTCGEDDPPFLPDSLQDDPYTAKLKHKSLLALAQHNFAVFNTEVLPMSGGKVYEGEVYSAAYVASAFSNSNGSGGGNVGNINGSGGGGNDLSGHYGNTMSGSSGSSGSSSSSSGAGSGGGSSNVVDKTPHGQGVLRYPPPRGALEGANGDVYAGGWFHGQRHGLGTMQYADGSVYTGWYKEHQRHGHGVWSDASGTVKFAGNCVRGKKEVQRSSSPPPASTKSSSSSSSSNSSSPTQDNIANSPIDDKSTSNTSTSTSSETPAPPQPHEV